MKRQEKYKGEVYGKSAAGRATNRKYRKTKGGKEKQHSRSVKYNKTMRGRFTAARRRRKEFYNIDFNEFDRLCNNGCEECGFKDNFILDFHHIDKDRKNNNRDNIAYLCPNCHARHHRIKLY